jgi:hypothetical protein
VAFLFRFVSSSSFELFRGDGVADLSVLFF